MTDDYRAAIRQTVATEKAAIALEKREAFKGWNVPAPGSIVFEIIVPRKR